MTISIEDHPEYAAMRATIPEANQQRVCLDDCPGCGKPLKKFGGFMRLLDDDHEPPLLALSIVCPTCARRIENSPGQRQKIVARFKQTFRLVADVGGRA